MYIYIYIYIPLLYIRRTTLQVFRYCTRILPDQKSLVIFLKLWKVNLKEQLSSAASEVAIACFSSIF